MKKLLILFSVFLLLSFDTFAQQGWFQQVSGTTAKLSSVCFVDENNGWAVGDSGTILNTTNGGDTWNFQTCPITDNLSSVQFFDQNIGWIVGNSKLLRTTDGGENWVQKCDSLLFFSLSFIDNNNGWASGTIKTTDGGNSWSVLNTNDYWMWLLEFVDFNFGWGFGKEGLGLTYYLYRTSDGGNNWEQNVAYGQYDEILVTSICFVDNLIGWYVTSHTYSGGEIYHTTNRGDTWLSQYSSANSGFNDIFMFNIDIGWAVGAEGQNGIILNTNNGGDIWVEQDCGTVPLITSIHFIDSNTGWAVGNSGTILKTITGGNVPDTLHVPADYSTIQGGIDAANNGDIVLVADGSYYENINYRGKAITVASHFLLDGNRMHIENTIINGSTPLHSDSGSVVTFNSGEDTTSVLCGFTITGGTGTEFSSSYRLGGGIYIYGGSPVIKENIIENNTVMSNSNSWGSAIFAQTVIPKRTCIIENNIIRSNLSQPLGSTNNGVGAVTFYYSSYSKMILRSNNIYSNLVTGNYNLFGGGVDVITSGNDPQYACIIENNKIVDNIVDDTPGSTMQRGGGIYIENVGAVVRNNIIAHNSAEIGGGIFYRNTNAFPQASPLIENNTIFENTATGGLCGAITTDERFDILNCIIWGNSSPQYYGTTAIITWSDLEETYPIGSNNISSNPEILDTTYFLLSNTSPCIDAGNPDPMYNDVEDQLNPGNPMPPAQGILVNDIGHCGGPNSLWGYWAWPIPVELTSFTASISLGKVTLNWSTATETNNGGFEIQRKSDNDEWGKTGFVAGHGTTTKPQEYTYVDDISNISTNSLAYRLKQIDFDGSFEYSDVVYVNNLTPTDFTLLQNFPNPFNPATTIEYSLPLKSQVELVVYNSLGEQIAQLVNELKEAGKYIIEFDASTLSSGVYFYKLQAGNFKQTKKMVLMK